MPEFIDEKQRRLQLLNASQQYLRECSLEDFRIELLVQALDGVPAEERAPLIERASAELENEAIVE